MLSIFIFSFNSKISLLLLSKLSLILENPPVNEPYGLTTDPSSAITLYFLLTALLIKNASSIVFATKVVPNKLDIILLYFRSYSKISDKTPKKELLDFR